MTIATATLKVVAEEQRGIDEGSCEVAREAESNCPLSNALGGSLKIELQTKLR
jgi:organic hydroperoxide reductase OsmC/OhrA